VFIREQPQDGQSPSIGLIMTSMLYERAAQVEHTCPTW